MVNNRKDSCSGGWESCGGVVCACGGEVVERCMLCAGGNSGTLEQLEHWNNWDTGTTGTLEQLEHWNNWNTGTPEQPGQQIGGCRLCREEVW